VKYKGFELTEWEREPSRWRVAVARTDGTNVKYENTELSSFVTAGDAPTIEQSILEAKNLIDDGMLR
jgi:hypothetical protein